MKYLYYCFLLIIINSKIFCLQDINVEKIKKIITENNFYMCDEIDLKNYQNKNYQFLKYMNPPKFYIDYDIKNNTIEISEGVKVSILINCKASLNKKIFSIKGLYKIDADKKIDEQDFFYIYFYEDHAEYFDTFTNIKKNLYMIDKKIPLKEIIKKEFKKYWSNKFSEVKSNKVFFNEDKIIFKKNEYEFNIYPVIKDENGKFFRYDNLFVITIINNKKSDPEFLIIELFNDRITIKEIYKFSDLKNMRFIMQECYKMY